jgi:hypothetical protein
MLSCLGSNYRNISSLTLVQKVIPGYLQRTVDNYSRAYLWLVSHDLSHGVPLMRKWSWKVIGRIEYCLSICPIGPRQSMMLISDGLSLPRNKQIDGSETKKSATG